MPRKKKSHGKYAWKLAGREARPYARMARKHMRKRAKSFFAQQDASLAQPNPFATY